MAGKSESDRSGCFRSLVDIFQIIGAVAGVLSVLIAVVTLIYAVRNPERVERVIQLLAGVTPSPMAVAPMPTPMPYTPTLLNTPTPYAPNPTFTPYPTYTPYPTLTPVIIVATRGPVVVTPTPGVDEQIPPPGSVLLAGQAFNKGGITVWAHEELDIHRAPGGVANELVGIAFSIANSSGRQYVIRWKNSYLHLRDNAGREYEQYGNTEYFQQVKQFVLRPGTTVTISYYCDSCETDYGSFYAILTPDVEFLIFTIDEIAGLSNLSWRYDLP